MHVWHYNVQNFMGFKVVSLSVLLAFEFMKYCYKCSGGGGGGGGGGGAGVLFGLCLVQHRLKEWPGRFPLTDNGLLSKTGSNFWSMDDTASLATY